jgi:arsenate reductase (glutaredoxin)
MGVKIYHNPRCSKSREGLRLLEEVGQDVEIIDYLNHPPTAKELSDLITLLKITPEDLLRKGEDVYKQYVKDQGLTDRELINLMTKYPKLIERPIVFTNEKAVIGRPPSLILDFIK